MRSSRNTGSIHLQEQTDENILSGLLSVAFDYQLPVAAWRLPNQKEHHFIIDFSSGVEKLDKLNLEELGKGFVFSPYSKNFSVEACRPALKSLFIKAGVHLKTGEGITNHLQSVPSWFYDTILQAVNKQGSESNPYHVTHKPPDEYSDDYQNLVAEAVKAIRRGEMLKVVPSRTKKVQLPANFNLVQTFLRLSDLYPDAFVSLVSIPETGTWLGASPETLIKTYPGPGNQQHFRTMALAGTQQYNPEIPLSDVAWRQKEIEEQALVSRYIINCFKRIRLREFEENGPKTVSAGKLIHLRTDFTVNMDAVNFPELGSVMLELLHPTSAICGMPKESALAFLEAHEGYDRSFYSGFLGPVNIENRNQLFVNLRCVQLLQHEALLYAGAGVTANSNPRKEYEETEMKMQTIAAVLNA
jgi:isochorismate synthase